MDKYVVNNSEAETVGQITYGREGSLRVERSMFDHIERGAKLVIVGITPGARQRDLADAAYRRACHKGNSPEEASRQAKFAASFGGAMRANLVRLLDHVGAARWLSLATLAEAFEPETRGLVHFTSALRYPVFINGENYNGQPDMLSSPMLRGMIETMLGEEAKALPRAIWQPLGSKPASALNYLVRLGALHPSQIAPPLPHPSGANAERIAYFLGNKPAESLSAKTNALKLTELRHALMRFYQQREG